MRNWHVDIRSIKWIEHACFELWSSGKSIYIDPFRIRAPKDKADVIFLTHSHFDHMNEEEIRKVAGPNTQFVAPAETAAKLKGREVMAVEPDRDYAVGGINFKTVAAYNTNPARLGYHPAKNNWVGYIIDADGTHVYHAGDTDFTDEMKDVEADVALIPMGGTYTMSVDEAIEASWGLRAKTVIPMHYKALLGEAGSGEAEWKFKKQVKNSVILKQVQEPYYSF